MPFFLSVPLFKALRYVIFLCGLFSNETVGGSRSRHLSSVLTLLPEILEQRLRRCVLTFQRLITHGVGARASNNKL